MSGFQGPMQQGGPMPPQGGGGQQLPPQVLQMLMQRMQQQQQGGMPGAGGPMPQQPPQQGMMPPPGAGQPMAPPGQAGGAPGGPPPQGASPMGQPHMTPQQMASQGRFGDSVVAHLTPGEIEVPPQVQTPELMHMLQQAFAKVGVSPQQFTAGSPTSSHNPSTGAPEYSLLAALLPILGATAGSFIAPGIGTAIGGGLGGAAGGMIDHTGTANTALSALGGAAGGYLSSAGAGAAGAAGALEGPTASGATLDTVASSNPFGAGMSAGPALRTGFGAGLGSAVGGLLAPPQESNSSSLPPGFDTKLPGLNPNFNAMLGNGQSSRPNFGNYNPYAAATGGTPGGYNFYSPSGTGS
jgi:hypothetical protein